MSRCASYYAVQNEVIDQISKLVDEKVIFFLEDGFTSSDVQTIDKMWDGLHFLLDNSSNSESTKRKQSILQLLFPQKQEPNLVTIAIFGCDSLYPNPVVAITDSDLVSKIAVMLESIDINKLLDRYDGKAFEDADIYPVVIWTRDDVDEIKQDLLEAFNTLKKFYVAASSRNDSVIAYLG